jgi:hypothetical protein
LPLPQAGSSTRVLPAGAQSPDIKLLSSLTSRVRWRARGRVSRLRPARSPLLDPHPLAAQRLHQHRLHNQQDVLLAGVLRAQLGALRRVQAACEERAEDRRLDGRPVQLGDAVQDRDALARPARSPSSSSNRPPSK